MLNNTGMDDFGSKWRGLALVMLMPVLLVLSPPGFSSPFDGLRHYEDPEFGFTMLIPGNWQRIVIPEAPDKALDWEPGYAVGFESPPTSDTDHYADYIMIELLPGNESGVFETDGSRRQMFELDGDAAVRDRLELPSQPIGDTALHLTVFQAEQRGVGYTLAIYAVGEAREADWLGAVFELVLATFKKPDEPFSVS